MGTRTSKEMDVCCFAWLPACHPGTACLLQAQLAADHLSGSRHVFCQSIEGLTVECDLLETI